jgi:integrase
VPTMYTIPTIVTSNDLTKKTYIEFYFNNERRRYADARPIGLKISPNRAKTLIQRDELLEKLRFEFHKVLEAGTYPLKIDVKEESLKVSNLRHTELNEEPNQCEKVPTAQQLLLEALTNKQNTNLSKTYKRDLMSIYQSFVAFASNEELSGAIEAITTVRIEKFLAQFGSSGTYYMNKRRNLAILFAAAGRLVDKPIKAVKATPRRKAKAKLHQKYDKKQLKPILNFLKLNYPNLHVCCLLAYSSWLRPHEEIRLLTLDDFKNNYTEVHLSGDNNKGGNVRVVYVPDYARAEIIPKLLTLKRTDNIFKRETEPFNESYFNLQWSRAYKKMYKLGLVHENQTIYSFRHTAAVEVYRKTKDVYLLQKLLGHSSITVTLKYLRTLGELHTDEMKNAAPTL